MDTAGDDDGGSPEEDVFMYQQQNEINVAYDGLERVLKDIIRAPDNELAEDTPILLERSMNSGNIDKLWIDIDPHFIGAYHAFFYRHPLYSVPAFYSFRNNPIVSFVRIFVGICRHRLRVDRGN